VSHDWLEFSSAVSTLSVSQNFTLTPALVVDLNSVFLPEHDSATLKRLHAGWSRFCVAVGKYGTIPFSAWSMISYQGGFGMAGHMAAYVQRCHANWSPFFFTQ
jgi:hypothetical protein